MNKIIECPCGHLISADRDEVLISRAQEHAQEAHGMELTPEQALAMARPE